MNAIMQKWEYLERVIEREYYLGYISKAGEQGWEVCGLFKWDGLQYFILFKRPIITQPT